MVYLEDVNLPAKPACGIDDSYSASGGLAINFGIWQGFMIGLNIPYVLVHPSSWQKIYGIRNWKKLSKWCWNCSKRAHYLPNPSIRLSPITTRTHSINIH